MTATTIKKSTSSLFDTMYEKVRVYYNLHKNCWSVQRYIKGKGWRVFDHTSTLILHDCTFKVYESGRQRVIKEGKKNVHAYIIGYAAIKYNLYVEYPKTIDVVDCSREGMDIKYNPYTMDCFQDARGNKLERMNKVLFSCYSKTPRGI